MTRKGKNTARLALLNAAFILLCLVTLVPVLYALSISFSGQGAALSGDLLPAERPHPGKLPGHPV